MSESEDGFDAAPQTDAPLIVDLEGFEGPLDLLLTLARSQKVDLSKLSILALVEQYLAYIQEAHRLKLEVAADYLVMAAWLAYLKSRLMLPKEQDEEEPSAEELALRLQMRLQRLEAMRDVGARLLARDRLGRDVLPRGTPEAVRLDRRPVYDLSLYELLKAYAGVRGRVTAAPLSIARRPVYSLEQALERLSRLLGTAVSWTDLSAFVPKLDAQLSRSATASLFAASLELARQGRLDLRQLETFGPLYLRKGREEEP